MSTSQNQPSNQREFVGTIVGESTSRSIRLAISRESVKEQDIIAIDAELRQESDEQETSQRQLIRIWAKVQKIERINPLFPIESGHELAETQTSPFDTVLSLSREMVTAVCQILGYEPIEGAGGKLDQLRYPPQPATQAYKPTTEDVQRIVIGELKPNRSLDVATLSNRKNVDVNVDGHAIVLRHLAILAMTGAGKSWAARRIIEQLAGKNYPIVIFDPHGDYTGLADIEIKNSNGDPIQVERYYAQLNIFEEESNSVVKIIESLSGRKLANTMSDHFNTLFRGAKNFVECNERNLSERRQWLENYLDSDYIRRYGLHLDLYSLANFFEAVIRAGRNEDQAAFQQIQTWTDENFQQLITKGVAKNIESLPGRTRRAAKIIARMEEINRRIAGEASPLPTDRTDLVQYGKISVISLAGYTNEFQATLYSMIADEIFNAKVQNSLRLPVLMLLEEAHNFVPAKAMSEAEAQSISVTKQIAQEGRKFSVGLILISQRPSRLDETTLSMCNSFVIMRMVNPADQNFVKRAIESLGGEETNILPDLDKGEALLSGQFINFPVLVKMKAPESRGQREEADAFEELEKIQKEITQTSQNRPNGNSRRS